MTATPAMMLLDRVRQKVADERPGPTQQASDTPV